jgi:hypothetical protein
MVYIVRISFGGVIVLDPRVIHTCIGRESEATTSLHLASCMYTIGRAHGACGQLGLEGEEQGEDHKEREGRARGAYGLLIFFFQPRCFHFH